jgi:hypothetical protein
MGVAGQCHQASHTSFFAWTIGFVALANSAQLENNPTHTPIHLLSCSKVQVQLQLASKPCCSDSQFCRCLMPLINDWVIICN